MLPVQDSIFQGHSFSSCPVEIFAESESGLSSVLVLEVILLCYILALSQCFMVLFNVQLTMTSLWSYFISYCVQDKNKCLTHRKIFLGVLEDLLCCWVIKHPQ